ncbi:MAG: hypothetical protein DWQ34_04135 [Planctomycetota bacterium]|nr:MAG: hypothetical protein DWQ29_14395 [Planctomycetota bacterium]REJ96432.1 MAG: hypothetical protein DWQ34_04135 [Planctomycetota bacterium]REK29703.1 MAG: hypothetical protein DWQ41_03440 [Planctomycetota bacterium]REK30476.1 MAG: hypothetical protein DWQ45_21595 [Planctomycetota bacterium]
MLPAVLFCAPVADACSVPVFRYALEHWRADAYLVQVFHKGELTPEQAKRLEALTLDEDGPSPANVVVVAVDVDGELDEGTAALWERQDPTALPWMVIQAPGKFGAPAVDVWAGEFESELTDSLADSPVRSEIAKLLLEGESAVWALVECGDAEQDAAAFELLQSELQRLEEVLELPPIDPADLADLTVAPEELKLSFAAVRVPYDDPREQLFREMLLSVEPDLRAPELTSRPMAFPIFGRGRALYALAGAGLHAGTIEDACRHLVGACTCTIKAQNADGFDLVMATDWDRFVQPALGGDDSTASLTGLGEFDATSETAASFNSPSEPDTRQPVLVPIPEPSPEPSETETSAPAVAAAHQTTAVTAPPAPVTGATLLAVALILGGIAAGSLLFIGRR